jgi:predicted Ser/Thr protein kinase
MTTTSKFLESVREHRESKKREKFSGYLEDYLQLIEKDRGIPALAHRRLHDKITSHGVTVLDETDGRCNKLFNGETVKSSLSSFCRDERRGEPSGSSFARSGRCW